MERLARSGGTGYSVSFYARLAGIAAIVLALVAGGWWCYGQGKKSAQAEWNAEKLATSESARLREQAAQKSNERVDRDYQKQKAADRVANAAVADSLRQLNAAADRADTATACGADDPRPTIARECTAALAALDGYARSMASQVTGLQGYASNVCVNQ